MSRNSSSLDCKVYVGGLPKNASKDEIERAFGDFGKLTNIFVARNPPGFAFIEFDDARDASDAVRALDGRMICGVRARVEISHGKPKPKRRDFNSRYRRSRSRSRDRYDRRNREKSLRENRDSSVEYDSPKNSPKQKSASRSRSRSRSSSRC